MHHGLAQAVFIGSFIKFIASVYKFYVSLLYLTIHIKHQMSQSQLPAVHLKASWIVVMYTMNNRTYNARYNSVVPARCRVKVAIRHTYVSHALCHTLCEVFLERACY